MGVQRALYNKLKQFSKMKIIGFLMFFTFLLSTAIGAPFYYDDSSASDSFDSSEMGGTTTTTTTTPTPTTTLSRWALGPVEAFIHDISEHRENIGQMRERIGILKYLVVKRTWELNDKIAMRIQEASDYSSRPYKEPYYYPSESESSKSSESSESDEEPTCPLGQKLNRQGA